MSWSGWESLGGQCLEGLGSASWDTNRLDVFTVGTSSVTIGTTSGLDFTGAESLLIDASSGNDTVHVNAAAVPLSGVTSSAPGSCARASWSQSARRLGGAG